MSGNENMIFGFVLLILCKLTTLSDLHVSHGIPVKLGTRWTGFQFIVCQVESKVAVIIEDGADVPMRLAPTSHAPELRKMVVATLMAVWKTLSSGPSGERVAGISRIPFSTITHSTDRPPQYTLANRIMRPRLSASCFPKSAALSAWSPDTTHS